MRNQTMENDKEAMNRIMQVVPALRMIFSDKKYRTLRVLNSELARLFSDDASNQAVLLNMKGIGDELQLPRRYLFLNHDNLDDLLEVVKREYNSSFILPCMLLIKGIGAIMVGDDASDCYATMNMFQDRFIEAYKILSKEKNISIDEHLLKKLEIPSFNTTYNDETIKNSVSYNKTIIVTGAAQGFGEGIARNLILKGANIVVADLNEEVGKKTVEQFNSLTKNNRAIFVKTDVSDMDSITNMVQTAVVEFGGIDTFISNAGVLRAGGLDDMSPQDFDFVTKINYNAYFYCTKIVSKVMKLQTKYAHKDYYADIIQINSKSGLRGSKANFAYAGGKFGGIGLTQSFALELAPHRIKVNSICPGNYYEGPLWSDPENGLFTQYLKAGKVPGAKTVEEVKAFYLAQVPMNKGCTPEDVVKAVLYLMDQCGETGQALPITGGQVMMS